jgi:hypothetical protein
MKGDISLKNGNYCNIISLEYYALAGAPCPSIFSVLMEKEL